MYLNLTSFSVPWSTLCKGLMWNYNNSKCQSESECKTERSVGIWSCRVDLTDCANNGPVLVICAFYFKKAFILWFMSPNFTEILFQTLSIVITKYSVSYIDGLVQDCSNSSALALGLLQSCTQPSIWYGHVFYFCWALICNGCIIRAW